MSFEIWLAFAVASAILLTIPGPTVMMVLSFAMRRGRSSAWATVPGVALGDALAMSASLLGAGAVLAASATLFTLLKLLGAAYLIFLAVRMWRAPDTLAEEPATDRRHGMFFNAFAVTALNPKTIPFFVAFVPQFVDPAQPYLPQVAILITTFVALGAINAVLWALLAGTIRARFRAPGRMRLANRFGALCLAGGGVYMTTFRHAS